MATLRSRKYLSCFYCGRRSKLRFEGQNSFVCAYCEATNWLDEYGDITDPPSATLPVERSQVQFAIPRASSFRSPTRSLSPVGSGFEEPVFCDICLRNQHMLTNSLAQFEWPDDHNSVEYAARERKYWALRKDLEKRYPQMCANCEPKVEKKLNEASYTAQTDHLRRMIARTRSQRKEVKRRGILDVFDFMGKWTWYLGFALQFLWHIAMLWSLAMSQFTLTATDSRMVTILKGAQRLANDRLPLSANQLMQWAINLGICSLPWNPRFKQTIRGFTAHYLGFKHWYTYQLLTLLIRYAGLSMAQYSSSQGLQISAQLGAQFAIALLMTFVYYTSKNSIRTDTTPLFRRHSKIEKARAPETKPEAPRDRNDLGSILDEISQSSSKAHADSAHPPWSSNTHPTTTESNGLFGGPIRRPYDNKLPEPGLGSLNLSDAARVEKPKSKKPEIVQYEEEMDWTPSASQHRAFSSYNPYKVKNTNPRFSDIPIEPKSGPIWYKVPPAPTSPAQRIRNPPMRPLIRESPKEKKENFFQNTSRGPLDLGSSSLGTLSDFKISEPKFFAPEDRDDPRDGLSNMFANSFSISPDPEEERYRRPRTTTSKSIIFGGKGGAVDTQSHRVTRSVELLVLIIALGGWIAALRTQEQYGSSLALSSIIACLIVSIRLAADLQVEAQMKTGKPPSIFAPSWANLGLALVVASLILAWTIWLENGAYTSYHMYGSAHFATVIVHHMWHTFA